MDDFKKFCDELSELAKKIRLANESSRFAKLADKEKQELFMRLVILRADTVELIQQLQADLNKGAGNFCPALTMGVPTAVVYYSNLDGVKEILKALFGEDGSTPE